MLKSRFLVFLLGGTSALFIIKILNNPGALSFHIFCLKKLPSDAIKV
jgi:hypothetical protein